MLVAYAEIDDAAQAAHEGEEAGDKRCGKAQIFATMVIVVAIGGSIAWSMLTSAYDTSDYNWVDDWQVGIPRFIGGLLGLLYGQATLWNHLAFVDFELFAKPCADPESQEGKTELWRKTPTEAKGAAVSSGGWCVSFSITLFLMTLFEPGCQRGLCLCVILSMVWWNLCWYVAMLGRVDIDDARKLPAKNWFFAETTQEIVITAVCSYFVFFAGGGTTKALVSTGTTTTADVVRVWALRFVGGLLTLLYGVGTLCKHTMFVSDFAKPLLTEASDPVETWRRTPTAAKHSAVSSGGWCVCFAGTILAMTFLEPGCEKGLCKCVALVMLWWNCVWYAGMLNRVDFNDSCKRPWTNWFKAETIQEIVIGLAMGYLGYVAP